MKYFCLAIISAFIIATGADQAFSQQTEIGFKGGFNIYSLNFENNFEAGNRTALQYGFVGRFYPVHIKPLSLQTELNYSPQGVHLKSSESAIRLTHINIPILFQYRFYNNIRVQAGPQLGFLMNAWADYDGATHDIANRFRKADLSLSAGFSYPLMNNGFEIDIRYNLGLSRISTDDFYRSSNLGLQVNILYLFDFK